MLDLPSDDDGPGAATFRHAKKSKATGKVIPQVDLPPDDDGCLDLQPTTLKRTSTSHASKQRNSARGAVQQDEDAQLIPGVIFWDDDTLKSAAASIPSTVHMPFQDLVDLCMGAPESKLKCTLWEIFSVPRLGPYIRQLGGTSRRSYDIRNFWDLGEESYQRVLLQDVASLQPLFLIMSPPCTWVCQLMRTNWKRLKKNRCMKMLSLEQACRHIDLCMWLAAFQMLRGNFFAMEHPAGSLAWERDSVLG